MRLAILRHGKAVGAAAVEGRDEARYLTAEGRREIQAVARALVALGLVPDQIWSSRWTRAWQTAEIVAHAFGDPALLRPERALEAPPDPSPILARLAAAAALDALIVVGHNPSLEDLAACLIDGSGRAAIRLKKGALAVIEIQPPVAPGGGVLSALWTPRDLRALEGGAKKAGAKASKDE
jgi:phosphohistidine phosphatase